MPNRDWLIRQTIGGNMAAWLTESAVLESLGGARIFVQAVVPPRSRAMLVICHGICEHQGRYERTIRRLAAANIACISFDLRGHGRSSGIRGHIDSFGEYLADLETVLKWKNERGVQWGLLCPSFLMGHSMGGVIVVRYLETHNEAANWAGLVLSAPGFAPKINIPTYKKVLLSVFLNLYPALRLPTGIRAMDITTDPAEQRASSRDPLGFSKVSLQWYSEFLLAGSQAVENAFRVTCPIFAFYGTDDKVVSSDRISDFLANSGSHDKSLATFPGLRHELLNERLPERETIIRQLADWIIAHGAAG